MGSVTNGHPLNMEDSGTAAAAATAATTTTQPPASGDRESDHSRPNSRTPSKTRQPSTNGTRNHSRHPSTSRALSSSNSVASSREGSPIRPPLRRSLNSSSASPSVSRSRRNSEEGNLSRPPSDTAINSQPSEAAALQKKLSSVTKPHLPPPIPSETAAAPTSEPRRSSKSAMSPKSGDPSLQWPISPRLKSPPPLPPSPSAARNGLSQTSSPKPLEDEAALANTSSKRQPAGQSSPPQDGVEGDDDSSNNNNNNNNNNNRNRPPARVLTRGTNAAGPLLSTVQEAGTPVVEEPGITLAAQEQSAEQPPPPPTSNPSNPTPESGSDSGGSNEENNNNKKIVPSNSYSNNDNDDPNKRQLAPPNSHKPGDVISKRSFTSLSRNKPGEASMKNMIVETETVSSIPQTSLGGGATDRSGASRKDSASSVRMKASDETIRPKNKDKKKQARKAVAIAGNASSKADVFEAKVANAVDDANTSDSEETFVYESNPPDSHPNRQHRYHSRTPSATSMGSQIDQYGGRPRLSMREISHGITGKRSMKFTNTYNTMDDNGDDMNGGRGSSRNARHYHSSRPNRSGAHLSLLDQSPFKSHRHLIGNGNRPNRSLSPRLSHHSSKNGFKKDEEVYEYDYDAEGADDERTPLISGSRSNRNRQGRRPNSANMRQMEYIEQHRRGWFSRWGVCVLLLVLVVALIGCATTFIVGVSKSITDLRVREIQNVLASEQEIMLDLDVEAINPNLIPITMNAMDVKVFAKSRYVGSQSFWRDHGPHPDFPLPRVKDSRQRAVMTRKVRGVPANTDESDNASSLDLEPTDGIDHGTDPIDGDDPSEFPQIMLLGRIFHLYSPLTFEPSPWQHEISGSVGQVQLTKPGNKTEEGGSIRWEKVLQHPFELIVRGVVKYELPLSSRSHSASINSKTRVYPGEDSVGHGNGDDDDDDDGDITVPDDGDDSEPSFHTNYD